MKKITRKLKKYLHLNKNEIYGDNRKNSLESGAVSQKQDVMNDVFRNHTGYKM